jgi:hypothetical protein
LVAARQLQGFRPLAPGGVDGSLQPSCRLRSVAGLRQDEPSQPVQLGLIVAFAGDRGGFGRSIQRAERVVELIRPQMSFGERAKPLGILQVGTKAVVVD